MAVLGIVAGCVAIWSPSPAPAADAGARVQMVDNEPDLTNWHFDPAEITVPIGSTVTWLNKGNEEHTVTADNGSFDSGYKKSGTTFQRVFPTAGRFTYHCAPHPWMKGTVVVAAGAPTPTRAAADAGSSTTTAPAPAETPTTLPSSLAAPTTSPGDTATSAPETTTATAGKDSAGQEDSAAPAASRKRSGGHLASTIAVVLLPTLGGLAIGSRLRRLKS